MISVGFYIHGNSLVLKYGPEADMAPEHHSGIKPQLVVLLLLQVSQNTQYLKGAYFILTLPFSLPLDDDIVKHQSIEVKSIAKLHPH